MKDIQKNALNVLIALESIITSTEKDIKDVLNYYNYDFLQLEVGRAIDTLESFYNNLSTIYDEVLKERA